MATPKKHDSLILLHWRKVEAFLRKNYGKASLVKISEYFGLELDDPKLKECIEGMVQTKKAEILLGMDRDEDRKIPRLFLMLTDEGLPRDAYSGASTEITRIRDR